MKLRNRRKILISCLLVIVFISCVKKNDYKAINSNQLVNVNIAKQNDSISPIPKDEIRLYYEDYVGKAYSKEKYETHIHNRKHLDTLIQIYCNVLNVDSDKEHYEWFIGKAYSREIYELNLGKNHKLLDSLILARYPDYEYQIRL
ncbi:MAG: hypothetical protein ACK5L5_11265 [Bacteroidales bacterium]